MHYDFNTLADRLLDNARKWDANIARSKFPNVRKDFIPLWIADMDFQAAPEIREALAKLSENGAYGYTYATQRWRDSVIAWHKCRHQSEIENDWITLGYGTVPNLHVLVQAFLKPEDCVLINIPVYGPFAYAARHNDRKALCIPLIKHGSRYDLNWNGIEDAMQRHHPKLVFFCNPHNPSGRVRSREELIRIAALCKEYEAVLISDEVHSEHIMNGQFVSALHLPKQYFDNLIMLTSPNKAFNLGGLKLSYSIIPNPKLRAALRKQYERNSITSPNVPGQVAMTVAYEECGKWLDQSVAYIKENLILTERAIKEGLPGWELMDMDSSYLPWVDVASSGIDMNTIAEAMANDAGVIVGIGNDYVADADHFIRLNLGTSHEVILEAMDRMSVTWSKMMQ